MKNFRAVGVSKRGEDRQLNPTRPPQYTWPFASQRGRTGTRIIGQLAHPTTGRIQSAQTRRLSCAERRDGVQHLSSARGKRGSRCPCRCRSDYAERCVVMSRMTYGVGNGERHSPKQGPSRRKSGIGIRDCNSSLPDMTDGRCFVEATQTIRLEASSLIVAEIVQLSGHIWPVRHRRTFEPVLR
jgi:hypothetical protein